MEEEVSEPESLKTKPSESAPTPAVGAAAEAEIEGEAQVDGHMVAESPRPAPKQGHSSAELLQVIAGTEVDAPLCFICGTKTRLAGSCHVCEGCGRLYRLGGTSVLGSRTDDLDRYDHHR